MRLLADAVHPVPVRAAGLLLVLSRIWAGLCVMVLLALSACAAPPSEGGLAGGFASAAATATLDSSTVAILMLEPTKRQFVLLNAFGTVLRSRDAGGATTLPSISVSDDGRRVAYWRSASSVFGAPYELVIWDVLADQSKLLLTLSAERPWGRPILSARGDLVAYATSTFEPPSPPETAKLRVMSVNDGRERVLVTSERAYPIMPLAFSGEELDAMQYAVDGSSQTNMALNLASGQIVRSQTSPACRDVQVNYQSGAILCTSQDHAGAPFELHAWTLSTFPTVVLHRSERDVTAILRTGTAALLTGVPGTGSSYELRSQEFAQSTSSLLATFDLVTVPLSVSPDGRWLLLAQTTFPGLAALDLRAPSAGVRAVTPPVEWRGAIALGWVRRS